MLTIKELIRDHAHAITVDDIAKSAMEAVELIEYFVDRVEAGTIRSTKTYTKYKEFLSRINQPR